MKYKLQDLIDMDHFQSLQDRLNEIYSFPSAIIDNEGNVLTATAWQDVCTKFHRQHPDCLRDCVQSDQYIVSHLREADPAVSYRCPRGLVDNATPIIIEGVHYGNFFTGQFFLEPPDLDFFRDQARTFGFDPDAYLAAVAKVPIWSREQLDSYLYFIKGLIVIISESALKNLREIETRKQMDEAEQEREKLREQLLQAQKMESVGRLAGGIAHDFNNMLGVILGHTELALEQLDPQNPLFADLMEIRKAASRSADLTRQLLAFARKQTVAPQVLDLNDTVAGMLKMLRRMIGENIELVWVPEKDLGPVKMDPSQIDQVLANLCVNSCDAIKGGGKITITTATAAFDQDYCDHYADCEPGQYARITVSDDGCGMDRETIAHIFEPFFTTKRVGEGTGLGLATVYGIVKQNQGFINVYSEPGLGTTFNIYLPRHQGSAEPAPTKGPVESTGGLETILLVEDEPAILNIGGLMLEKLGYSVLRAGAPSEALRIARQYPGHIHLLMTDVVMPEMNGRELAREILALQPRLKLLYMSGYTSDVIATHGVLDEGVHFIQKPFSTQTLDVKVREALLGENPVLA